MVDCFSYSNPGGRMGTNLKAPEVVITTPYNWPLAWSELHRRTFDEVRRDPEWIAAFQRREPLGRRDSKRIVRAARGRAVEEWPHNLHGAELRLGTHGRERDAVIYQEALFCALDWCPRAVEWPQRTYCEKHKDPHKRKRPAGWMSQLQEAELAGYAPITAAEYELQLERVAKRCSCEHYLPGPEYRRRPKGWESFEFAPLTAVYRDGATLTCTKCGLRLPKPFFPNVPRRYVSVPLWAADVDDWHPFERSSEDEDDILVAATAIHEHDLVENGLVIEYHDAEVDPEDLD
jgi:hypothetical protein